MHYEIEERVLHFKQPAGTSRGVYTTRKIWLVHLSDGEHQGVGECAPLPDLSCDAMGDAQYLGLLNQFCQELCDNDEIDYEAMRDYPSMLFGLETALLSLQSPATLFDTAFSRGEEGIPIVVRWVFLLMVLCGWETMTKCSSVWRRNSRKASVA